MRNENKKQVQKFSFLLQKQENKKPTRSTLKKYAASLIGFLVH